MIEGYVDGSTRETCFIEKVLRITTLSLKKLYKIFRNPASSRDFGGFVLLLFLRILILSTAKKIEEHYCQQFFEQVGKNSKYLLEK